MSSICSGSLPTIHVEPPVCSVGLERRSAFRQVLNVVPGRLTGLERDVHALVVGVARAAGGEAGLDTEVHRVVVGADVERGAAAVAERDRHILAEGYTDVAGDGGLDVDSVAAAVAHLQRRVTAEGGILE